MNNPVWIDEKGKIVEPEYCRDFLSQHPMRCINDRFYTVDGPLPDESKLKRTIYEEISPWLHAKVAQTVEQIIKARKKSIVATAFRCPIGQMLLHRNTGCTSFQNCWNRRIFPPCRSIWATA